MDNVDINESKIQTQTVFEEKQVKIIDEFEIDSLIQNFNNQDLKKRKYPETIDTTCPLFKKNNFILSSQAIEKCNKVYHYMIYQIPCILEGETGTSKSFTASMMAQYRQWKIIEEEKKLKKEKYTEFKLYKFSLSKETKISDLFGKYTGSSDSLEGIKMTYGPFIEAFSQGEGHCLLLDEINLAPISVLQCIEEAIDTGVLSIEITGLPLQKFEMKPNFCLIATQNKQTKYYKNKRESPGIKFLSKFQIVEFEELGREELIIIAKGIRDNLSKDKENEKDKKNKISDEDISKLVDFHIEWNKSEENNFICFTIRQIYSCIESYFKGENLYNIIYNIYGKTHKQLEKFQSTIQKYFKKEEMILDLPKEFPDCFRTKSIQKAFKQVEFTFNNGSNVIISGKKGCGKTTFALYMAEFYNKKKFNKDSKKEDIDFMICTSETSCSDIIGKQILLKNEEDGLTFIEWKYGFLLEGVREGKCIVLDNINEIQSQVTERANNLFDLNLNSKDNLYFEIPENPNSKEQKVEINKNFRLIATCDEDKLNTMTPAFLNRFKIIYFDDQLNELQDSNLKSFIEYKINKLETFNVSGSNINENNMKKELIKDLYNKIEEDHRNILNSMKTLSFYIEAVCIFKSKFKNVELENKVIIDYIFQLINPENKNIIINEGIFKGIKKILVQRNKKIGKSSKYFFKNSKELCSFLINAYSSYLIHMHMRFEGPTGIGKTIGACALGRIIAQKEKKKQFYIQSFHSGTKPSQFFGGSTIIDNKEEIKDGLLTLAMTEGTVYIADEFNLSTKETMKAILPALSHFNEYNIYIPGLEKRVKIHKNFIFIACQNKVGTLGRNKLPDLIESSLREFIYPSHIKKTIEEIKEIENDVQEICSDINNYLKVEYGNEAIEQLEAKNIGNFMLKFNQLNKNYIQPLSLRDIKKILKRIYYQKDISKKHIFIGFEVYHNIIFYILSKLNKKNVQDIKKDLSNLISGIFKLKEEDNLDTYFEKSLKLEKNDNNQIYMIKGLCKVNINIYLSKSMEKRIFLYANLHNFLNPFFYATISSQDESLLFLGKTSCKTYLCETLFTGDEFETIHLNQETKISQLLGGPMIFSKKEAENFYFKYLCNLCGNSKNFNELYNDYKENKLTETNFYDKSPLIRGLEYAIERFKQLLFNNDEKDKEEKNDFLSKYTLVFKPGFILDSLIKNKPFVLKDISNLHTDVLERFNQFFSEERKIVLIEDIYNTFTTNENKEIIFYTNNKILATANNDYENNLSEAILSRFTVINVESYEFEEEKIIINMEFNNLTIHFKKEIEQMIELFRNIESILKMTIILSQKIKIIRLINKIQNSNEFDENVNISEIIIFNMFKGLFEFRTNKNKKFKSFINLFKDEKLWNYEEDKSTLYKEEINSKKVIKSHNTHLYIESPHSNDVIFKDIAFTEKFCENIDIIHFAIKLKIPLILEGTLGIGKKTALNYIFKLLNIEDSNIINIYLSDNTKKEDLLGKITATPEDNNIKVDFIQTDLLKALINENGKQYAIIFHNINKASPGIFELLENIFDSSKESILLPNGENPKKSDINPPYLFGIYDTENGLINRNSLPRFLIRSCIYFIVQNPDGNDIRKIITSKFKNKGYELESNYFGDKFLLATEIQNKYSSSDNINPLSLNDINKFIALRDITYKELDISIISQFILVYRHSDNEKIQEIIQKLKFKAFNFIPKFNLSNKELTIDIEENEDNNKNDSFQSFKPPLNYNNKFLDEDKLNTLTKPQKHCLLFLFCSYKTNRSIILQGNTNSGKTHLITLFSKMVGKKLHIYQMNKDINLSMFFGQSSIRNFTKEENDKINELCIELSNLINSENKNKNWNPNNYTVLCKEFKEYSKDKENYNEANKIYLKIKDLISITKRFESITSPFCDALIKGDWILIEQIESAPIEIIEKLIPLCDENPELKIIKGTEEITYKKNNSDFNINEDFRIFFTFNPNRRNKNVHPSLFSKCLVFTLPQIDSTLEYCSKIYYGSFRNIKYPKNLSKELSGRLSNVHRFAKEDSKNFELINNKSMNIERIFTGRTIKFISNEITNLDKNRMSNKENININYLNNIIHSTFEHYYYNFYDSKNRRDFETFKKNIEGTFSENPPKLQNEDNILNKLYFDIYQDLETIKKYSKKKRNEGEDNNNFKLSSFLNKTLTIKFMHLGGILEDIKEIYLEKSIENPKIFKIYQGFRIIINLLENIIKEFPHEFKRLAISDSKSLENNETRISCSKLVIYNLLLKEKYIISENIIPEFLILKITIIKTKNIYDFKNLVIFLNEHPNMFDLVEKVFPFKEMINLKELTGEKENDGEKEEEILKKIKYKNNILVLWIELFCMFCKKKINFKVQFDYGTYQFNFGDNNNSILNPTFCFSHDTRYFLTNKSYFYYINKERKEDIHRVKKVSRYESYLFYQLLYKFTNYKKYIPSSEQYETAKKKCKKETEELIFFEKFRRQEKNIMSFLYQPEQNKKNDNDQINEEFYDEEEEIEDINDQDYDEEIMLNKNQISPLKNVLSLYFNYSKNFFDEIMNNYFSQIEKNIYTLLLENFDDKLKENNYIIYTDLIRMLDKYLNNYLYLYKDDLSDILNNNKERNIKLYNLNRALENMKEIKNKFNKFNFDFLIGMLEKQKEQIDNINKKKENEMEKQIIFDSLDIYKNNNNKILIENMKEKIKADNLNPEQMKFWKKVLIDTPKNEEEIQNNDWPIIRVDNDDISEEFIKHKTFIDTLMRYSEIKNILDENLDKDNNLNKNKFFQMLIQLSEYDEMRNIANYIFNIVENDYSISPKIIKILNSVLNCSFIMNLSEYCINKTKGYFSFKIIDEMFEYIDGLITRKIGKDEIIYIKSQYSTKYRPNFKVRFPKFSGMDLIYLFVDINDNCEVINNYLIKNINLTKICLGDLKNIEINLQGDNYKGYLDMIVKIIFEDLKYDNVNVPDKVIFLKEILRTEENNKQIQNLCKIIIQLYNELDILRKDYIFNLDDLDIYKYVEDKKIIEHTKYSKYPSLIFFMLDYKCDWSKLLINKYNDKTSVINKGESMPFWLFCLRYFSSIECIISKTSNYFSKIIDDCIKKNLREGVAIGKNWLNFVCFNNKTVSFEPFYERIKLFLYKLSKDEYFMSVNNNNNSYINNLVKKICDDYINNIFLIVFQDNSLKNYYTIKESNVITDFLRDPNKYLYIKITSNITNYLSEKIDLINNKNAINRIITNIKEILIFKEEELKFNIINELNKKNEDYKDYKKIQWKEKKRNNF